MAQSVGHDRLRDLDTGTGSHPHRDFLETIPGHRRGGLPVGALQRCCDFCFLPGDFRRQRKIGLAARYHRRIGGDPALRAGGVRPDPAAQDHSASILRQASRDVVVNHRISRTRELLNLRIDGSPEGTSHLHRRYPG